VFLGDGRVEHKKEKYQMRWGKIIMRNWDLENVVCESIDHPRYSRYESPVTAARDPRPGKRQRI
jgi:hypothetical protein